MKIFKHAILLIIDDVRADQFFNLVSSGELKNIKDYLMDGLICQNCITTFISTTVPAHNSILTGHYMDGFGIPSLKFVDRSQAQLKVIDYTKGLEGLKINDDMSQNVKTIYEMVKGNSISTFEFVYRGASKKIGFTREEYLSSVDKVVANSFLNPDKYFKEKEEPELSVNWYFESDSVLHTYGPESAMYLKTLRGIDKSIGRIIKNLIKNGYFDDTVIIVTSDHGNYSAHDKKDLSIMLAKHGLTENKDYYADFGGVGMFYFREGTNWHKRPSLDRLAKYGHNKINLFDTIMKLDGVQRIYFRDEDCSKDKGIIHMKSHNGEGFIEYRNGKTKYTYEKNELFGYETDDSASKLLDGKFHSIEEWLEHTYHIDNPIIIDQLPRLLNTDKQRSADIIAETDVSTIYNHLYSHDVCLKSSMTVPLLIAGKDLEKKEISFAKVADITPTILKLLGEKIDSQMIGKSLI